MITQNVSNKKRTINLYTVNFSMFVIEVSNVELFSILHNNKKNFYVTICTIFLIPNIGTNYFQHTLGMEAVAILL